MGVAPQGSSAEDGTILRVSSAEPDPVGFLGRIKGISDKDISDKDVAPVADGNAERSLGLLEQAKSGG